MKILANENIPRLAIVKLQEHGHDVVWVRKVAPGVNDRTVILMGTSESRLLITFDKDFGELCYRQGFPAVDGVVLFRQRKAPPINVIDWIVNILESRSDWTGNFTVVEVGRIRMNRMPHLGDN